jgi:hypothetical protein
MERSSIGEEGTAACRCEAVEEGGRKLVVLAIQQGTFSQECTHLKRVDYHGCYDWAVIYVGSTLGTRYCPCSFRRVLHPVKSGGHEKGFGKDSHFGVRQVRREDRISKAIHPVLCRAQLFNQRLQAHLAYKVKRLHNANGDQTVECDCRYHGRGKRPPEPQANACQVAALGGRRRRELD